MSHHPCPTRAAFCRPAVALPLAALTLALLATHPTVVHAQDAPAEKAPNATPGSPAAEAPPRPPMPTRNVRVTVTLTDQLGTARPVVRTAVLTVADGRQGMLRSVTRGTSPLPSGTSMVPRETVALPLSVDAVVNIMPSNNVLLRLGFNYHVFGPAGSEDADLRVTERELTENLTLLVTPGQAVIASESADAVSDRKVKVEVKADILP